MFFPGSLTHEGERFLDATWPALQLPFLPFDLGLSARAFRLCLLSYQKKGKFLKPQIGLEEVGQYPAGADTGITEPVHESVFGHEGFFAPAISLVYTPISIKEGQGFDGLGNRPLEKSRGVEWEDYPVEEQDPSWLVGFKPALCPYCGSDLQGEKESHIFLCHNCDRAWEALQEGLRRVDYRFMPVNSEAPPYWLPFWRIEAEISGGSMPGYSFVSGSLVATEQRLRKKGKTLFWFPAFKISPSLFATITRALNFRPPRDLSLKEKALPGACHPVTLSGKQALEGMEVLGPSLLKASLFGHDQPSLKSSGSPLLVYLPFRLQGNEWVQEEVSLGINKNALKFGRLF
jgi:hypothetical protein